MPEKLLSFLNPNANALEVPQEEGEEEGDHYFGSIGDATMQHVTKLNPAERQLWEDLYCPKSGDIFLRDENYGSFDNDPLNIKGKDIQQAKLDLKEQFIANYFDREWHGKPLPKAEVEKMADDALEAYEEVFQAEQERQDSDTGDVYDNAELIPFDQWEQFPQMWKHIDIPSTPKPIHRYMGNTTQPYYDYFPEGHPDAKNLNQIIQVLNRDWDKELDSGYCLFARDLVESWHWQSRHCKNEIILMIDAMNPPDTYNEEGERVPASFPDLDAVIIETLQIIDQHWAKEYKNRVIAKALGNVEKGETVQVGKEEEDVDPEERATEGAMLRLLMRKETEWKGSAKAGYNVYADIKAFGQLLFQNYRDIMNGYHWARYRRVRDKHAPKILFHGFDINRCSLSTIMFALGVDKDKAEKVWHARPFESIEQVRNKGFLTFTAFSDTEEAEDLLMRLEQKGKLAMETRDAKHLNDARTSLMKLQRGNTEGISAEGWTHIWRYYRILRNELERALNDRKEENEDRV